MTLFNNYKIQYLPLTTWVEIDNVVQITCNIGRKNVTDYFPVSTLEVRVRYPDGYATPLTNLNVDVPIQLSTPNSQYAWSGYIKDARVEWGKPYVSSKGEADYLIISADGALGKWGRQNGDGYTYADGFANGRLTEILTNFNLDWTGNLTDEPIKGDTITETIGSWFQKFVYTTQSRVIDGFAKEAIDDTLRRGTVYLLSNASQIKANTTFSDITNDATHAVYDQIEFDSLADNFYTQVLVQSNGLTEQTANSGSAPYRTYQISTIAASTGQMQDIADYVLAMAKDQVIAPASISVISSAQNSAEIDSLDTTRFCALPILYTEIEFRGTTFTVHIEGATLTADPDQTRVTYYVSPYDANRFFILDSADFGILDTNKLALYDY